VTEAKLPRWALSATLGGFLFGYHSGVVAGALLPIRSEFGLSNVEQGLLVALLPLGAMIGSLINRRLADGLGRRKTLIVASLVFMVGTALAVAAPSYALLLVARALTGLAVGSTLSTVPVYLSEISPPDVRGRLVTANQIMIAFGILAAYAVDLAFADSGSWRAMFAVGLVPAVALFAGMLRAPESPELPAGSDTRTAGLFRDVLAPAARPAIVIGVALALIQQLSGINAVIYYAPTIMERTGLDASNSILYSLAVGAVNALATVLAFQVIDRAGRRPLLLASLAGACVSLVLLGLTFEIDGLSGSWVTLICLLAYIVFFAVGLGPIFWLLIAEIVPTRARAAGVAVAAAVSWGVNFAVGLGFLPLVHAIGEGPTFWGFAAICAIGFVFVSRYVPETKQRSLAEIGSELHERWEGDGRARMKRRALPS
jgi:SP family galactose:H+ symporter-like MFS transporter